MIDTKTISRIEHFVQNKINDFAPTISPAPKNLERKEVESLYEAIEYFLSHQVNELLIQKKYMGSYCSIYLKRNFEETYFVSRNGHLINYIDLSKAKEKLQSLHSKMVEKYPAFETMIIASELLPWSAMGKGLIDREYQGYLDAHKTHFEYLSNSNLYQKIADVKLSHDFLEFKKDKSEMKESELKKKYKSHILRQYHALDKMKIIDLDLQKKSLDISKQQIDHFGKEDSIEFKPFNILKIVNQDGSECIPNDNLSFRDVNSDAFLHLKFDEKNKEENIEKAYSFFNQLTSENEEGIMIKPAQSYINGLVPCFKVRNNNYLTMIYGVNFANDYEYYLSKRNIHRKMEQSIIDWKINYEMLQLEYKDIHSENYLMKLFVLKRIEQEDIENTLDKRL